LWETSDGSTWHARGIEPDEEIRGDGRDFASSSADQLKRVLEILDTPAATEAEREAA
jgi:C-terminal processing protease CtpA/Prc